MIRREHEFFASECLDNGEHIPRLDRTESTYFWIPGRAHSKLMRTLQRCEKTDHECLTIF